MKSRVFLVCFCFLCFSCVLGQSPFSADVDSLILHGIDQTFVCEFDSALSIFRRVTDRYPDHLVGYFYQAVTLQSRMMDYETDRWEGEFYRLIERAIDVGEGRVDGGDDDPWTYFYLGNSYSYKGLHQAKTGHLISGFLSARKGQGYLRRAAEADSSLYDAYLGLGNYKYWAGRFYRYLRWLPWIRDERGEGIRLVTLAVEQGSYSHWAGLNSLAWIEYDRKRYEAALSLFQKGLEKYPDSRFFIWGVADSYFRLEDYAKAIQVYEELLASIQAGLLNNGYNEAECRLKLLVAYYELGRYEEAYHHCKALLERKVEKKIARRLRDHYKQAEAYRKRSLEALGRRRIIRE